MAHGLDNQRFSCSVCLELYTDPVSTPCGHNFCKLCIEKCWNGSETSLCPVCKEPFHKRPELQVNNSFQVFVNHHKNTNAGTVRGGKAHKAKAGEVACDVCTGVKVKATKSCLVCMASYCESHLEPHKTAAALSRHKLIQPVRNLEDRICTNHEKILELYCKQEDKFICRICAQTDHRGHTIVTADAASQQKMTQSKRKEREVELMIQDRKKRIEEINYSKKQTEENAKKEIAASVQVFMSVIESIQDTHTELIEKMEARNDAEQKRFEELVKELRREIDELEKKGVELQQLPHIEDHITLLEAFNNAYKLPSTKDWTSIPVHEVDFLGYIQTSLIEAREFIDLEIREQSANEFKKVQIFAEDITIDPDTAGPWLTVSEDGKEVRQSAKKQKVPTNLARFTETTFAVGTRGLSTGRHYWEVGVKEKSNWVLGVASNTLRRSGHITPSPENGLWTVAHRDGRQYFVCRQNPFPLTLSSHPQRVGVFVDYEESRVAFFDAEAKTLIFTFTKCNFTGKVYPIFDPCLAIAKKEAAPLKLMTVYFTR
ncbi:E3 ubiquitin-protein ligase TRIM39-like [Anarrhichthys ocellatus]|uniref:E3 ubiquitin-protein ligase TRIM39-like n=1 Tax=Anarrhichthys ocellatus TaxID=433405 RepID=UPI0012EEB730|nr:E3 ubiquitin-protein ligase TRIM39-like [Anarrhichthys ocellatus]